MVDTPQKHPSMLHPSKCQATLPNSRSSYIWPFFRPFIAFFWQYTLRIVLVVLCCLSLQ